MKFFIVFAAVIAAVSAVPYHAGMVNTGASAVSRSDDVSCDWLSPSFWWYLYDEGEFKFWDLKYNCFLI